jgi:hypothetical protein
MSLPQHSGDFIFPLKFEHSACLHSDILTWEPSSRSNKPSIKGLSHSPHDVFTDIPHSLHL